ncbi:MAG: tRNA1(Val) (adenine(37)-N6)-methyltransferase [Metamycoplasmataceae bacterium]
MINEKMIKNSLGYDSNLYVYQDKDMFNYSVDTILLANFTTINSRVKNILEIGTNNGALSIFLSERNDLAKIDAIEIQKRAVEIAKKNIELNKKSEAINIIEADFNEYWVEHCKKNKRKYDLIIVNPPFYRKENKLKEKISEEKLIATHEIKINLKQIVLGSSKIINQKGYLSVVIPPERLVDLLYEMRFNKFEPKRIKMVFPRINTKPILALVEARYQSGWGTKFEENIYLHPEDKKKHEYLPKVVELYKPLKIKK